MSHFSKPMTFEGPPRLPRDVMDTIADAIGLRETGVGRAYEDCWNATIQGEYAVASFNKNTNFHLTNTAGPSPHILSVENGGLLTPNTFGILRSLTSTVVHLPTRRVVRSGLPPSARFTAADFSIYAHSDSLMASSRGVFHQSYSSSNRMIDVRPSIEGPVVFVWKHGNRVMFSTTKRVDAKLARIGSSNILSEMYAVCGGPPIVDLFPDPDGDDGMCYIFRVVHPDFMTASRVECGKGYVQLIDVIDVSGKSILLTAPTSIPWAAMHQGFVRNPTIPQTITDSISDPVETKAVSEMNADEYAVVEKMFEACDDDYEASRGDFCPYPAPSAAAGKRPPRGNANESAERCLRVGLEPEDENEGMPPTYYPGLIDFETGMRILSTGFYNDGAHPFAPPSQRMNSDGLYGYGEPVVVREYCDGVPVQEYEFVPAPYYRRLAIIGEDPNVAHRVARIRHLAEMYARGKPLDDVPGALMASLNSRPGDMFYRIAEIEFLLPSGAYSTDAPVPEGMTPIVADYPSLFAPIPLGFSVDGFEDIELHDVVLQPYHIPFKTRDPAIAPGAEELFGWAALEYVCAMPYHRQSEVLKTAADFLATYAKIDATFAAMKKCDGRPGAIIAKAFGKIPPGVAKFQTAFSRNKTSSTIPAMDVFAISKFISTLVELF